MSFTAEEDIILVEFVKNNKILYDVNNENYNDSSTKGILWLDISAKINKTVKQCKKRWKNIKSAYTKNKMESNINDISESLDLKFLKEISPKEKEIEVYDENEIAIDISDNNDIVLHCLCDNGDLVLESSDNQCEYAMGQSREDKIANVLANSLRERNLLLFHNLERQIQLIDNSGHFTVTLTQGDKTASNNDNDQNTPKFAGKSLESLSPNLGENLDSSKEKHSNLHNLEGEISEVNIKSETIESLNLFFKSISIDMEDFSPVAINKIKLDIMKCVTEIRNTNYDVNILTDAQSTIDQPQQKAYPNKAHRNGGHIKEAYLNGRHPNETHSNRKHSNERYLNVTSTSTQTPIEMFNGQSETIKSLDLFFKSLLSDMKDFCAQAVDDAKIRILKCISDIRGLYLYERHDPVMMTNSFMPNNDMSNTAMVPVGNPQLVLPPPPIGHRYVALYNYPYYCPGQPTYTQTFY